jgi:two-component system LytT family response regulator
MIRCVIIDDEPLAVNVLKEYLETHEVEIVAECNDGFSGLKAINEHEPELVFLDVQMPKISGIEMLELLDNPPSIIFTTAFEQHAIQAFEANAIDYLLKPFDQARLDRAIGRYKSRSNHAGGVNSMLEGVQSNRIVIKDQGQIRIIPITEVLFLEADDDYIKIHTKDRSYLKKATLSSYEKRLPNDRFLRVHRSYIANVSEITRIDPYEKTSHIAILKSGDKLPVSKSGYQNLKSVLGI